MMLAALVGAPYCRGMADIDSSALPQAVAPHERAPERRRAELLAAATAEFAAHGFAGARMQVVADRTTSNKALIYGYFGSKEGLYLAVLESLYASIRKEEQALALDALAPEQALRRLVRFTFDYYVAHPEFVAIISNENLMSARFLKQSASASAVNRPIIDTLARLLERGRKAGVFRSRLDPIDVYLSISSLGYMYVSNRHTLGIVFGRDLMAPDALRRRLRSITDTVLRSVAS